MRPSLLVIPAVALLGAACNAPLPPSFHQQPADLVRGVPIVDVEINGIPSRCVIDTGNSSFFVSPSFGGTPWNGFTDPVLFDINSLILAAWEFQGQAVTAQQSFFDEWEAELGQPIDCWLGNGVVGNTRFTIDYANGLIELADEQERPMRAPDTVDEEILIEAVYDEFLLVGSVNLAGRFDANLLFDSGASVVSLGPDAYEDLDEPPVTEIDGIPYGTLPSVTAGSDGRIDEVAFLTWDDPQFEQLSDIVGRQVDGSLGASFLAGFQVTWDFPYGVVRLRAYDPEVQQQVLEDLRIELGL